MQPNGVILTARDFKIANKDVYINPRLTNKNPGMLLIWGDFCGHCHRFMPTFNEIADIIGSDFCCASIESKELKGADELSSALNFGGFPTIKFFDQSGLIMAQYDGDRSTQSILDKICKVYHHCVKYH